MANPLFINVGFLEINASPHCELVTGYGQGVVMVNKVV